MKKGKFLYIFFGLLLAQIFVGGKGYKMQFKIASDFEFDVKDSAQEEFDEAKKVLKDVFLVTFKRMR